MTKRKDSTSAVTERPLRDVPGTAGGARSAGAASAASAAGATVAALSPCYGTALRRAARRVAQLYDGAIAPTGLRATQFSILAELHVRAAAPPALSELAEVLVLDRSALGHNLRPLERDGYVRIVEGDPDRRVRRIVLTASGQAKYREARERWKIAQKRFATVLGEHDAGDLREKLLAVAYDERLTTNPE